MDKFYDRLWGRLDDYIDRVEKTVAGLAEFPAPPEPIDNVRMHAVASAEYIQGCVSSIRSALANAVSEAEANMKDGGTLGQPLQRLHLAVTPSLHQIETIVSAFTNMPQQMPTEEIRQKSAAAAAKISDRTNVMRTALDVLIQEADA